MTPGAIAVRLTSRPLIAWVLGAYWVLSLAVLAIHYREIPETVVDAKGRVLTGDFVAFYSGALIVRRGAGASLYDPTRQVEVQAELGSNGLYPFVYPASFAAVLSPLGALSFRSAFLVSEAVNFAAGLAAAILLARAVSRVRASGGAVAFAAAAGFPPVLQTWLAGGQTTTLTLLVLASGSYAVATRRWRLLGVSVGLLGYKPQLLPSFLVLLVVWRAWSALSVTAVMGAVHWAVGAAACGPSWPIVWLRSLGRSRGAEQAANYGTHVSWLAACERLLPPATAHFVAPVLAVATLALVVVVARREGDRRLAWALAVPASLLVSPHARSYDLGLLVLPALIIVDRILEEGRDVSPRARAGLVAGFFGYPFFETLRLEWFQPLLLWPVFMGAWATLEARRAPDDRPAPAAGGRT